jgi:hypothetical protein
MLTNDTRGTTAYSLFAARVFVTIFFLIIRALRAARLAVKTDEDCQAKRLS